MKIYNYHPETKEFLNEDIADKNPLEKNKYLIPANATTLEPIRTNEDEVATYKKGQWVIEPDLRGRTGYHRETGELITILEIGEIPEYFSEIKPEKTHEEKFQDIRNKRNLLLLDSDKYMIADFPLTNEQKELVLAYRQLLRDLPQNITDIDNVVFPELKL